MFRQSMSAAIAGLLFVVSAHAQAPAATPTPAPAAAPSSPAVAPSAPAATGAETGLAAVYSDKLHGRKTASGQIYDRNKLTAAHKTLPFGTRVKVTHARNGRSVELRINDRGPTQAGRVLDISPRAAQALGMSKRGLDEVRVEIIETAQAKK